MKLQFVILLIVALAVTSSYGTDVSGNVSGVWNLAGSPYMVTCDVTVPAGQTLTIEPGVQVLFTGPYRFNVYGNLQAIGTEQDSIVFTRAFPTEESRGRGLKIINSNDNDTCRFQYCSFSYGKATSTGDEYSQHGGAIGCWGGVSVEIDRCTFDNNHADDDGGAVIVMGTSMQSPPVSLVLRNSTFTRNNSGGISGGTPNGILVVGGNFFGSALVERCLFYDNHVYGGDGGAFTALSGVINVVNCTFVNNSTTGHGAAMFNYYYNGSGFYYRNSIVWGNAGMSQVCCDGMSCSYSDIEVGPQCNNGLQIDPLFVDPANGHFHLQDQSPCIDTGDPNSPLDPDGSRADMGAFPFTHCPPTALPFLDSFDSFTLDSCWSWIRPEDPTHWSLTDQPGWLRIIAQYENRNWVGRYISAPNFVCEIKITFQPTIEYQQAGFMLYRDQQNHLSFARDYIGGQMVAMTYEVNGEYNTVAFTSCNQSTFFLRLRVIGTKAIADWSPDSVTWVPSGLADVPWLSERLLAVTLLTGTGGPNPELPADFDYLRMDSIPGTPVCGEASGLWDLAHSPYYVNCHVTVPAGQTLTIQPGVHVLFTGHYKFNVLGNLQAIGTEQDSIVFTRAFPTEESKWWGLRLIGSQDTSRMSYCVLEYGKATGPGDPDNKGGGVFISSSAVNISYSKIHLNEAIFGGGIAYQGSQPTIDGCLIEDNVAAQDGGGLLTAGGWITRCVIVGNLAGDEGGGIRMLPNNTLRVVNSTIVGNAAGNAGGGILRANSFNKNMIVWGNAAPSGPNMAPGDDSTTYSDIQGGYPGEGNIDSDPLFVDELNRDFHLTYGSPCVDAGNPGSPLDPDGSRADMGAFPYTGPRLHVIFPNGGESWTLFNTDTIRWSGTGFAGGVTIELNRDFPNGPWELLAENTDNDGGEAVALSEPISTHCRVRISAVEDVFSDVSDGDFSIVPSQGYLGLVRASAPNTAVLAWNAGTLECPQTATELLHFKNFGSAPIVVYRADNVINPAFSRITDCALSYTLAPDEMSACGVTLSFAPDANGSFLDTLRIHTNASNGVNGYLRVPLSGSQISTPATPQVVITTDGPDAHLWWQPITQSTGGCPVTITNYLVFYAGAASGPYWYHGWTPDTTYTHYGVVPNAGAMFYRLYAVSAPGTVVNGIPQGMREEDVLQKLTD